MRCTNDSHIFISQSLNIQILNLEFIGRGGNQIECVEEFVVKDAKFEGQKNSGTALNLFETTVQIVNIQHIFIQQKAILKRMSNL